MKVTPFSLATFLLFASPLFADEESTDRLNQLLDERIALGPEFTKEYMEDARSNKESANHVPVEKEASEEWTLLLKEIRDTDSNQLKVRALRAEFLDELNGSYWELESAQTRAEIAAVQADIAKWRDQLKAINSIATTCGITIREEKTPLVTDQEPLTRQQTKDRARNFIKELLEAGLAPGLTREQANEIVEFTYDDELGVGGVEKFGVSAMLLMVDGKIQSISITDLKNNHPDVVTTLKDIYGRGQLVGAGRHHFERNGVKVVCRFPTTSITSIELSAVEKTED